MGYISRQNLPSKSKTNGWKRTIASSSKRSYPMTVVDKQMLHKRKSQGALDEYLKGTVPESPKGCKRGCSTVGGWPWQCLFLVQLRTRSDISYRPDTATGGRWNTPLMDVQDFCACGVCSPIMWLRADPPGSRLFIRLLQDQNLSVTAQSPWSHNQPALSTNIGVHIWCAAEMAHFHDSAYMCELGINRLKRTQIIHDCAIFHFSDANKSQAAD